MATPANPDTLNTVGATDDASKGGLFNSGSNTVLTTLDANIAANVGLAQTAATDAATSATSAATSAATATTKASQASANASNTAADAIATAADRVQTGNDATASATSATNSQNWAVKTNGIVDSTDYASKAWAIGGTGVTNTSSRGAAKEWAITAEDSTVDGSGYSSLHWAAKSAASASTASTQAGLATTAKNDAVTAKNSAEAAFDSFDDRYLGAKSSDPSTDNDGNALITGALYFDSSNNTMKVWTGSAWVAAYVSGSGFAALSGAAFTGNISAPKYSGTIASASGNLIADPATQILEVKGDGSSVEGQIQLNCHANSHGQIIKAQPHSTSTTNTMLLPQGANSTLVSLVSTDTLTNKTLTSPTLTSPTVNGGVLNSVTASTQTAGTNNTTLATTAFAVTEANNAAVAMAIALG